LVTRYADALTRIDGGLPVALKPVTNRLDFPNGLSSGSNASATYRTRHYIIADSDVYGVRLRFANRYAPLGVETTPADTVTYKAALEAYGKAWPVTFSGSRTVVLAPGAEVLSDPVPVKLLKAGFVYARTWVQVDTVGKKWVTSPNSMNLTSLGEGYFANSDAVDAVTTPVSSVVPAVGPVAILANLPATRPVIGLIGSSTLQGQGDTAEAPTWEHGWPARAFGINDSVVKLGIASDSAWNWIGANSNWKRQHLVNNGVTHCMVQVGQNDVLNTGDTVDTTKGYLTQLWDMMAGLGFPLILTTFTPVTTSSDSWVTLANQTPAASNTRRQELNAWVRSRPHSAIVDVWDIASVVEDRTTAGAYTGKFKVTGGAWTVDGQHMTPLGHRSSAAAFRRWMTGVYT
jgi:hypothetical protein